MACCTESKVAAFLLPSYVWFHPILYIHGQQVSLLSGKVIIVFATPSLDVSKNDINIKKHI